MKRALFGLGVLLLGSQVSACKEEPPPPPKPLARSASPAGSGTAPKLAGSALRRATPAARISDQTMKQYRVEACFYGSLGLTKSRDAYLKSLGGAEPSPEKLPSFGDFGAPTGKPNRRMALAAPQLPFMRHVRSCSVAKSRPKPAFEGVDAAVADFELYASKLNRYLVEASRYYARKQFEKDDMKRGKELHVELTKAFSELDAKLVNLDKAIRPWQAKLPKASEKLDKSGELAAVALVEARKLASLYLEPTREAAALRAQHEAVGAAVTALDARAKEAANEPHAVKMLPELTKFLAVAESLREEAGVLDSDKRYELTSAMATLIDVNQRAIQQLLRKGGGIKGGGPFRMRNPRMNQRLRPNKGATTPK